MVSSGLGTLPKVELLVEAPKMLLLAGVDGLGNNAAGDAAVVEEEAGASVDLFR